MAADYLRHTYHPGTFGLAYGQHTAKTACGKRTDCRKIVLPSDTNCPACQDVVLADMRHQRAAYLSGTELVRRFGYRSLLDWFAAGCPDFYRQRTQVPAVAPQR
jgi:hypothetical protein